VPHPTTEVVLRTEIPEAAPSSVKEYSDLTLIVGSVDLAVGNNRLVFGIIDANGASVQNADAQLSTYLLSESGPGSAVETTVANFRQWPFAGGVYTAKLGFHVAGIWEIRVSVDHSIKGKSFGTTTVQIKETSVTPSIGSVAPRSRNRTLESVGRLDMLTSDPVPDKDLYMDTIDEAISLSVPVVIVFSTPAFCKSLTCGPQVDVLKNLKKRYRNVVRFIHIEIYENPHEIQGDIKRARISPIVLEWKLLTEPSTFVLDREGLVYAKFEGFTTEQELELPIVYLLKSIRGVVTSVSSNSFGHLQSFRLLTIGGLKLEFIGDDSVDKGIFTPSHLRQHGVLNEPVTVFFRETVKGLLVEGITD